MSYHTAPHQPYPPPGYSPPYPPPPYEGYPPPGAPPPGYPPPPPYEGYPPPGAPPPGYSGYPPPGPPRGYQGYFAEGYPPPPPGPQQYQECYHYEHHHYQDDGCSSFLRGWYVYLYLLWLSATFKAANGGSLNALSPGWLAIWDSFTHRFALQMGEHLMLPLCCECSQSFSCWFWRHYVAVVCWRNAASKFVLLH
ncbi:hypothetical protein DKX38_025204 [Salix brachista]|uniref:Uncharacterized protein n=1 Tax=Salix brachista TaxID=2182728 RepID=A0A5N5JUL8_9ROSI|nr:hypothetical protein DKX38_025204 [Salix brachista]